MRIILSMPGNEAMAQAMADHLGCTTGRIEVRRFPDGESLVRIANDVAGCDVDIVCTLANPDPQLASLLFAAATVRELGARHLRLVAPYLAYMRQDARFAHGEAVSAPIFARLLSGAFDALVTVEEGSVMGGAGSAVLEALAEAQLMRPVLLLGLPDRFIEHGDPGKLMSDLGLDAVGIEASVRTRFVDKYPAV